MATKTLDNLIPLPDKPVVTRGPAGKIEKPAGAMNSAFDTKQRKPPLPVLKSRPSRDRITRSSAGSRRSRLCATWPR